MSEMATLVPPGGLPSPTAAKRTFGVEALNMTKRFGEFTALDAVSLKVVPGTFHALLGENGAGKSTLVKCIMGYYQADGGELLVDDRQEVIGNPRAAHALGLGMVYQHFTLVPAMTVAENFVLARDHVPAVVDWTHERKTLEEQLANKLEGVDPQGFVDEIKKYNAAVKKDVPFNPNIKDGRRTVGLAIDKSNWANTIDTPPFEGYAVTCGLTFTFGGVRITTDGEVLNTDYQPIRGLYAAGELVGGLFYFNYPGGSGLMAGSVFGRIAGDRAGRTGKN